MTAQSYYYRNYTASLVNLKNSVRKSSQSHSSSFTTAAANCIDFKNEIGTTDDYPKVNEEIDLKCVRMASDGKGLCELPSGIICMVTGATIGEVAKVRITDKKSSVMFGVKVGIKQRSEFYQKPICEHFGTCGGCTWMDVKYEQQLKLKRLMVVEAFGKNGRLGSDLAEKLVSETVGMYMNSTSMTSNRENLPPPMRFRNKMTFAFGVDNSIEKGGSKIGLRPPNSNDVVVDVSTPNGCYLQSEDANEALKVIQKSLRKAGKSLPPFDRRFGSGTLRSATIRENTNGEIDVEFESTSRESAVKTGPLAELMKETAEVKNVKSVTHVQIDRVANLKSSGRGRNQSSVKNGSKPPASNRKVKTSLYSDEDSNNNWEVELCGLKFRAKPESFFQTNAKQAEVLVNAAVDALRPIFINNDDNNKEEEKQKIVLDLFSGVGVFALACAKELPSNVKVIGYEIVKEAVEDANENINLNAIDPKRCEFYVKDLTENGSLEGLNFVKEVDAIIVDPARAGCSREILHEIRKLNPKRIVYVSCNPGTQARDASILNGNEDNDNDDDVDEKLPTYKPVSIVPVDMFPHSLHVETIAIFDRI